MRRKAYCDAEGIAYEEASIANLSELQTACETLIAKGVDALYTGNDNSIASAMALYTDTAYAAGIPVYCGEDSMVADGGFPPSASTTCSLASRSRISRCAS